MTLCFSFLSPGPSRRLSLACGPQSISPALRVVKCASGYDDSVAGVVACLLARSRFSDAASSVSSRRAWRGAGHIRPRFCLGGRFRARLVLPSRDAWLMSSADCFDDLLSCLLFACYHAPSRPASRCSSRRASRCAYLASDVFFLCFLSHSPGHRDCLICPRARLVRRLVVPSRRASRAAACCHVLLA